MDGSPAAKLILEGGVTTGPTVDDRALLSGKIFVAHTEFLLKDLQRKPSQLWYFSSAFPSGCESTDGLINDDF